MFKNKHILSIFIILRLNQLESYEKGILTYVKYKITKISFSIFIKKKKEEHLLFVYMVLYLIFYILSSTGCPRKNVLWLLKIMCLTEVSITNGHFFRDTLYIQFCK